MIGALRRGLTGLILVLTAGPLLALVPVAVLDSGQERSVRLSVFAPALVASDPLVRDAVFNTTVAAAAVALGSYAVGLALGRMLGGWWFPFRPWIGGLLLVPLALAPAFGALGLEGLLGADGPARELLHKARLADEWLPFWDAASGWVALGWCQLAPGAAWVAWISAGARSRVRIEWIEAGSTLGAGAGRSWRHLIGPLVRPHAARAAAWIFGLSLFEVGAPTVLRLRRTLGVQLLEAAQGEDLPRLAILAAFGMALASAVILVVRTASGARLRLLPPVPSERRPSAGAFRTLAFWTISLVGLALVLTPWAGLGFEAALDNTRVGRSFSPAAFEALTVDSEVRHFAVNSLIVSFGVAPVLLAWAGIASLGRRGDAWRGGVPPALASAGILAVGGLAALMAMDSSSRGVPWAGACRTLAAWLDPYRTPQAAVIAGLVLWAWPIVRAARDRSGRRLAPEQIDAARLAGASPGRARRIAAGGRGVGGWKEAWLLAVVLTAGNVSVPLILAPTYRARTLGPGVLALTAHPAADARARAAALACAIGGAQLVVGVVAARAGTRTLAA